MASGSEAVLAEGGGGGERPLKPPPAPFRVLPAALAPWAAAADGPPAAAGDAVVAAGEAEEVSGDGPGRLDDAEEWLGRALTAFPEA